MIKILKKSGRILLLTVTVILCAAVLTAGVVNIAKYAIYAKYYEIESDVCKNPGLYDGFVCQGICINEASGHILVSGYMQGGRASRLYVTDLESNSYYVSFQSNGKPFKGHAGGVALYGDTVYLANNSKLFLFSLQTVLQSQNGDVIEIGEGVPVNNKASFCYADDTYVYVGEFHDGGAYVTNHPYRTPDGLNHAIVTRYRHDDLTRPDRIYSIRDRVQGICFAPNGQVVLSTSYGITDSHYYVYNERDAIDSGMTLDGAPLYYLVNCQKDIKGPAMAEGVDLYDGKILTLTESACNKYVFGKFFFADRIVALDLLDP